MESDTPSSNNAQCPVPPPPPLSQMQSPSIEESSPSCGRSCFGLSDIDQAIKMRQKEMQFKIVGAIEQQDVSLLTSLINDGVNLDAVILYAKTPLTYALELGHGDMACQLIRAGCDVEKSVESTMALKPIHFAVLRNCINALKELLAHEVNINGTDAGKTTALHYSCFFGFDIAVNILLSNNADITSSDSCGRTPLHRALERNHQNIAENLINHGASVDSQDVFGWPPLFQSIIFNSEKIVAFLIEKNCDLNIRDCHGNTALHLACDRCSPNSTQILVSTSIEYQKRKKKIPTEELTHLLIGQNSKPSHSMIQLLVNAGACINICNRAHETPMYLSAFSRDSTLTDYLYLAGGKVDRQWIQLCDDVNLARHRSDEYAPQHHQFEVLLEPQLFLSHQCRGCIRLTLGQTRNIRDAITRLPIPPKLKMYINECEMTLEMVDKNNMDTMVS
ncbi:tankyrase-1-like [Mizuhopecten yessoensis]|uniref:Serine/threonine-protein phosphatase 6 regulatory ankyrin repeat subunit B n=1 Tax=Mizuhopecten yessoensis TaxID=6573 RepID=A0A210QNH6_MIZYE|nr:tankyrase-1-like [Mizuhopecten yessoensis]OWF50293.1 Serine/threonine-protein phosphatase 6 regulatory ankyrin repeat subunit B [Mizuhopecten yessoensis]